MLSSVSRLFPALGSGAVMVCILYFVSIIIYIEYTYTCVYNNIPMKYPIYDIKFIYFVLFHLSDIYISSLFVYFLSILSHRYAANVEEIEYGNEGPNGTENKWKMVPTRQPLISFATYPRNKNIFSNDLK